MHNEFYHAATGAVVTLSRYKDGQRIDKIYVPPKDRGLGVGRLMLSLVLEAADMERIPLYLIICADDDSPLCNVMLERWYYSNGFRRDDGYYIYKRLPTCADIRICASELKKIGVIGSNAKRVVRMGRLKTPMH